MRISDLHPFRDVPDSGAGAGTEPSSETDDRREAIAGALADPEPEAQTEQQEQQETAIEPPEHWEPDVRERFRSADPEWQKWLVERDQAIAEQQQQQQQQWAPIQQAVQPWQGYLNQIQADPGTMLNQLMPYEFQLRTGSPQQKYAALMQLAQQYGVQPPQGPPDEKQLQEQDPLGFRRDIASSLQPLMQSQQQLAQQIQAMQQHTAQSQTVAKRGELEVFRDAKDDKGRAKNPYFDELLPDMMELAETAIARGGPRPDIQTLYAKASRLNEKVWAKMQNDQAAVKKQAEKDQKAAGGLAGSGGGGGTKPKTRIELLREGLAEMRRAS